MENEAVLAVREALWMSVQLAAPPLGALLVVGLVVSILQALTQVQEPTLAFLPKLVTLAVVLLLLGPAMAGSLRGFAVGLFDRVVAVGAAP
ncbi:flagellar biosynthetic protein FliQ [Belnapia sp. T6]|uniref:Flagellar biosynthetic protein FliQ n=1 Tax=Belnapia mucosa TaxID=2804532 RepID=A0ABS1UXE0_9PROT|nr:flagellar biosynthetic protein FliQ [Belnapia mucosa]MBL6454127.1 flagellar biosynthetic protein FliQ [Belnapia mucosa]